MMPNSNENICPRCGVTKMKSWTDLTGDEKFTIERLPASAEFTLEERKKHRFCERCFYEESEKRMTNA